MALNHAPVGSTPAPEAMPPRTACGSAFVRRTARFDPGWRLAFVVERDTRWPEVPVARKGYAGSNPAGRTMPLAPTSRPAL